MDAAEWVNIGINFAILIAMSITAWVSAKHWGSVKHQLARDDPYLVFSYGKTVKRGDEYPTQIHFKMPTEIASRWELQTIHVKSPMWKALLSRAENYVSDEYGGTIGYQPGRWSRSISLPDSMSLGGVFLLRNDAPSSVVLEFSFSLRSNSRSIKRWPARISITD